MNLHGPSDNQVAKSRRQKICLSMIVKDEASVIARCLTSVRSLIDYWIIVDTGSTDGTPDVVRKVLHDTPGQLHHRPWVDFAHNRSEALDLARPHGDYTLIIDADDVLELSADFGLAFLDADSYAVEIWNKDRRYWRPQLLRSSLPWRYEGVLHEFLSCGRDKKNQRVLPENRNQKRLPGAKIRMSEEGARRRIAAAERFGQDAAVLENALTTEIDPFLRARYKFYLAQSYLDAGDKEKALAAYQVRATLGFWDQEVFISLYRSANLKADLGFDEEDVIASYLRAHDVRKDRAEALYGAARYCRIKQKYQHGFDLAKRALKIKIPNEGLFLEHWVYQYALLDEFAVNAYWVGRLDDCLEACDRLLREGRIPLDMRERIERNASFAREKLSSQQLAVDSTQRAHADAAQSPQKTIGLCMIVKNESKVILRCLESVRPIVDYVLIEDTGSSDGTQAIIREWLTRVGLPGEVYDEPWQDFAYNRSHALTRLRQNRGIDYALIMDADDVLVFNEGFDPKSFKEQLSYDLYRVRIQHGAVWHSRPQICSNRREFRYRGVLHEFIEGVEPDWSSGTAAGFHILIALEGARSQDPDKYRKDAQVLEQALQTEQDAFLRSRYTFYLGRSYRDAGENDKALPYFLKRAELGYWIDEVFISLYGAAQAQQAMGRPFDEVIETYLRAADAAPHRAEALHAASRLCRENRKFTDGFEYARRGLQIAPPADGLFVESWIYEYGLLDEFAVNAYWIERYGECLEACTRLLSEGKLPEQMRGRINKNADFARDKLASRAQATPDVRNRRNLGNQHE